nr:ribonuclease H-like domain-containing protein [Tanacetum cinerariifolium]
MYKLDPVILDPKVKNNREAHECYPKHTMEQAAIVREVVEQAKSRNPLDSASYSACITPKVAKSMTANKMEPGTSQGSDTSVTPSSSSLIDCRPVQIVLCTVKFNNNEVVNIMGYGDYQIWNDTILRVYYVEGLGYNVFLVVDMVKFLASKDEAPDFIIKFLKIIQVRLNATVRNIRTDNGTEFANQTLRDYYEQVGISHETSVAQTPQQNGVVER